MGDFVNQYTKRRPTEYRKKEPETKKKFGIQQENNAIVQHAVDEIILQDNKKLGRKDKTHDNIDDDIYEDEL